MRYENPEAPNSAFSVDVKKTGLVHCIAWVIFETDSFRKFLDNLRSDSPSYIPQEFSRRNRKLPPRITCSILVSLDRLVDVSEANVSPADATSAL